jgi:hypothetical protein
MMMFAVVATASAAAKAADWFRDFSDGTFQGLEVLDYFDYYTAGGCPTAIFPNGCFDFFPEVVDTDPDPNVTNYSLRLKFHTKLDHPGSPEDIGLMVDKTNPFGDVSGKALIKFTTNPQIISNPAKDITVAFFFRTTITRKVPAPPDTRGYLVAMDDVGSLAVTKLVANPAPAFVNICDGPDDTDIPDFDVNKNWWLRGEAVDLGQGQMVLRGRAWPEGTPEPDTWLMECIDTGAAAGPIWTSGAVAIGAQEEDATNSSNGRSYVDVDDISVGIPPERICFNHLDDDGDGLIDCADPDCANAAACRCSDPFADFNKDGAVDQRDFGLWQACFTGVGGSFVEAYCDCADRDDRNGDHLFEPDTDGDGDVDMQDLAVFLACVSGPAIPANPACDDVNN